MLADPRQLAGPTIPPPRDQGEGQKGLRVNSYKGTPTFCSQLGKCAHVKQRVDSIDLSPFVCYPLAAMARPAKVRYTHDAMIDIIVANPAISQNEIADMFGYTAPWVSMIMGSDAFKARLELRRDELVDPEIRLTLEERFHALARRSLQKLQERLENPNASDNLILASASLAAKSLGMGQPKAEKEAADPERLERIGSRLLALMGDRVKQASRSLDYEILDAPVKVLAQQGEVSGSEASQGGLQQLHGSGAGGQGSAGGPGGG